MMRIILSPLSLPFPESERQHNLEQELAEIFSQNVLTNNNNSQSWEWRRENERNQQEEEISLALAPRGVIISSYSASSVILQSLQFGNKTDILMNKNKLIIDTRQTLETRFHMFMIVTMCGRVKNAETDMCQHDIVIIASYQDQLSPVLSPAPVYFLAIVNLVFSLQSTCCIWIMGMQEAEWSTQHSPP